ncbi:MAG: 4-hydroxy-2-oxoheptanedioate aldolase [Candidatus Binatus sp.]|uniref:4-hydroxy-2-oxoheptanedioate aldolase n=1 Tax=Candidatus Binatus sp. TaxID=2811406 RepID=UPI00272870DB|nr:4-hydroxy-2-oxoheptanedioate aldolase [Candidatus Binatus sp.]MDO8432446.1 4-hydroxy-2-oxoheptanedioate aldolase [Candidatus Binatus sp.]
MEVPVNRFKRAIKEGKAQIGLWVALADAGCAELCAGAGFDWLLLDAEHGPNDLRTLLAQLQAVAPYDSHPIVRLRVGDTHVIKQVLEIGAQTLLIPMVESAEQAASLVAAMHYPPKGVRGVGSALARSSRWTRIPSYLKEAGEEMCLLVQIETRRGVENLKAIAAVPGVDGVFVGPADLSASMGYLGNMTHPEVLETIERGVADIRAAGKAAGILMGDEALVRRYLELGCTFIAVGADSVLLAQAVDRLASKFKALVS